MDLKEFVCSCDSLEAKGIKEATQEFEKRKAEARKLAESLRASFMVHLDKLYDNIYRDEQSTFYRRDMSERFFAFVTPVTEKRFERLSKKLRETLRVHDEFAQDPWWWHAKDLARFRIVTANLKDLTSAGAVMTGIIHESSEAARDRVYLRSRVKDYIWTDPNEPDRASKSIHFLVCNDKKYVVEVQLMTLLQYSWDQVQHWFYEELRASTSTPTGSRKSMNRSFWALSHTLFVLDEYIVSLINEDKAFLDAPFEISDEYIFGRKDA